jgi:predicted PurR-regulated permease PerM
MTLVPSERARIETLAFYALVILLVYLVYQLFQPFLTPIGWAAVLVVCCHPWHGWLAKRYGRTRAAALSTAIVTIVLIVPALLLSTIFVREATQALAELQEDSGAQALAQLQRYADWIQFRVLGREPLSLVDLARQGATIFGGFIAAEAGSILRNLVLFLFDLIVTLFATFFLFRDGGLLVRRLRRALPFEPLVRERMIGDTRELISASVTAALVVASVQGAIGGITFAAVGIGAPVFWGVIMGFLALLPFGGPWIVWVPAAIWFFATGHVLRGLVLVGLGAALVSGVDNVLRPALLSGRAQMNGLLVFVGLLGGVTTFGLLGLVLGPVILAVAVGLFEAYTETR